MIEPFGFGPSESNEFFTEVSAVSAVQKAARQIALPGNGSAIPVLGSAESDWVTQLGGKKPVSVPSTTTNQISPYELAVIIPVSKHLLRDTPALRSHILSEGVSSMARKFDTTVLTGVGVPGSNFADFSALDSVTVSDRASFIAALGELSTKGATADAIVLTAPLFYELYALTNVAGNGSITIVGDQNGGTINGIKYFITDGTTPLGVIGAWSSQARWGTVEGIEISVSTDASLDVGNGEMLHLFQQNSVAVRIEARYGFQVKNLDAFADLTVVTP